MRLPRSTWPRAWSRSCSALGSRITHSQARPRCHRSGRSRKYAARQHRELARAGDVSAGRDRQLSSGGAHLPRDRQRRRRARLWRLRRGDPRLGSDARPGDISERGRAPDLRPTGSRRSPQPHRSSSMPITRTTPRSIRAATTKAPSQRGSPSKSSSGAGTPSSRSNGSAGSWCTT